MFFSNKNVHKYIHPYIIQFYNYLLGKTVATLLSQEKKRWRRSILHLHHQKVSILFTFVKLWFSTNLCKSHMWSTWLEIEKSCQPVISRVLLEKCHLMRYLRNSLFGKNEKCFSKFFTRTIYTLITQEIVRSPLKRENPSKTLES